MPLKARRLASFDQDYAALSGEDRARVDVALARLLDNPRHPSLQVKKFQGVVGWWEARLDLKRRLVFEWHEDLLIFMRVLNHEDVRRVVKRGR